MDGELRRLYEADQADQADRMADRPPADVVERDRARRRRVAELLHAGAAQAAEDFFHVAMVFQHGDRPEDISGRTSWRSVRPSSGTGPAARWRRRPTIAGSLH